MKREIFNIGFATLTNAFSYVLEKVTPEMQEIYWLDLQDIPEDKFKNGVEWCRHHGSFFPSISDLGKACYHGNEGWHEEIVNQKRRELQRKQKKLEPPRSQEQIQESHHKFSEFQNSVTQKFKSTDAKRTVEQQKQILAEQTKSLGITKFDIEAARLRITGNSDV